MTIGIAGIGRMGAAIAERLLDTDESVVVWNRTAGRMASLLEAGATAAATPAALARASDVVVSILTDATAIENVYVGPDGVLAADLCGKLLIEMSTVRPQTQQALAQRVRACGGAFVECPVGGSVGPAKEGKLFGFAGGESADVERARVVLNRLCRRIEHVGPVGAGSSVKLAINLPLLVYWQAFGEALSLCQPLGIDPQRLVDIFADTSGGPNVLKARGPAIAKALAGATLGATTFDVDSVRKDLATMIAEARGLGRTLPVTAQALACFDAASREGLGDADCAQLLRRWLASRPG
jgi:3-hydroxyisobutyrate dehydrogenase